MSTKLPAIPAGTWTIDPTHTEVGFVARHLMVTKVRGSFAGVEGTVTVPEDVRAATVDVTVQMATVDTRKGVTHPVTFEVEFNGVQSDPWGNTKAGFEAKADIKRADWGLTWNAAIEGGGVLVSDKIKIVLDVQLAKAS